MQRLSEGDYRKVLSAIEILGRDASRESLPERVVDAIATVIAVDFASYNEVDGATGTRLFFLKPDPADFEPGSLQYAAFIRRFGNHPVVAQRVAAASRANPEIVRFTNRLRFLGMVGNCCGEAELRLNMGVTLARSDARRVGVSLHRSIRDFDERDAAALDALRPHIVAAYRNARAKPEAAASDRPAADSTLTRRESEVLYWVSMGKTNGEVAEIIGARPLTVKKHLEHIYDKLGVPNRTAAARAAVSAAPPG